MHYMICGGKCLMDLLGCCFNGIQSCLIVLIELYIILVFTLK